MPNDTTYTVRVGDDKAGARLDRFLAEVLPQLSRTRLKALIELGLVKRADSSNAAAIDPATKVGAGEAFIVSVPPVVPDRPEAQAIALTVVYEDEDLIVIDKPAGLVVHPAPGNLDRTLVNALLAHCAGTLSGIGGVGRPGIVHRLDKDTGGLMVAAKNDLAHQGLAGQFADHSLDRAYNAVVWGTPAPRKGSIEGNIGRSPRNRKKMAIVARGGKSALTHYQVLRPIGNHACLIECRLSTGRTHQIRVHMASCGHSVIGDPLYGGRGPRKGIPQTVRQEVEGFQYQALHAVLIGFTHPRSGERLQFVSNLSLDINSLIDKLDTI
jgi:23S rRNA pseudouridine1911/1915/1917 synthase